MTRVQWDLYGEDLSPMIEIEVREVHMVPVYDPLEFVQKLCDVLNMPTQGAESDKDEAPAKPTT